MSHFVNICEFRKVHGQCRCSSKDKTVISVKCNTPERHGPKVVSPEKFAEMQHNFVEDDNPKPLYSRMEETVESFFGNVIMLSVREAFLKRLEEDVKDWLLDTAKELNNDKDV